MEEKKRIYALEHHLKLSAKRGNIYKYPIKIEDIPKMPRFRDTPFKNLIIDETYNIWRKDPKNAKYTFKFFIRNYQAAWKAIADALFEEMEDNLDGVKLPEQLGILYIGTPPNKDFYVMVDKPKYKYIVWRNKVKYCSHDVRYYFFHSFHKRYKSAYARDDYYKTAVEKVPFLKKIMQ